MFKVKLMLLAVLFLSCKKEGQGAIGIRGETVEVKSVQQLGKELFDGKGNCIACHQETQKTVGPSILEISKIYKEKNADMVRFLKGEGEAIVDPSQFAVMQSNLEITKNFSQEELKAIEAYIYSF